MPMDPAFALSFTNPMFPGMYPEPNWSSSYLFRQALEEQQAALTNAIAVNLHAQRMMSRRAAAKLGRAELLAKKRHTGRVQNPGGVSENRPACGTAHHTLHSFALFAKLNFLDFSR